MVASRPDGFDSSRFTGEVLPVLYVRDVLKSVDFYVDRLGFVCHHFFDHISGGSTFEWTYDEPPIYAEMRAGDQKFAIHRASNPDSLVVSGTRHYFSVANVEEHYRIVKENGVKVGDLIERPWMHMFRVEDPDGHELYIFTRPEETED
jgi:catechol 2,3-dioxygenase-like lactoylglutathione lyase family enzyme